MCISVLVPSWCTCWSVCEQMDGRCICTSLCVVCLCFWPCVFAASGPGNFTREWRNEERAEFQVGTENLGSGGLLTLCLHTSVWQPEDLALCILCACERDCVLCVCVYTHVSVGLFVYTYMRLCGGFLCVHEYFLLCMYIHVLMLNMLTLLG